MPYKDKSKIPATQLKHRIRNRQKLYEYLLEHPCVDCNNNDPRVLEFDHVRGEKSYNIGRAISGSHRGWNTILKEIVKCDVRCANCHRIKTSLEQNWYMHVENYCPK